MKRLFVLWSVVLFLVPTLSAAQSAAEIAVAKSILGPLQANSFNANREYCGIIGVDATGQTVASRPRKGWRNSCKPRDPENAVEITHSFHTHGAFSYYADSELPSPDDVYADMDEGLDGWVSTPGGRLWFVNGQTGVVRQICGIGCLPKDPDFETGILGEIPERLTLEELEAFFDDL